MTTRTTSFVLILILSLLSSSSALSPPGAPGNELSIGTFFGANWLSDEDDVRYSLLDSLESIQTECPAYEEEMTCSTQMATYCGITARHANGVMDHVVFYETFHARHMFTNCDSEEDEKRYEYGCHLLTCLDECFAYYPQKNTCQKAVNESRIKIQVLNDVEKQHDEYEVEFRRALLIITMLSSAAGCLVIFLSRQLDTPLADEASKAAQTCARICIVLNWIAALVMVAFIVFICPVFLVVIIPPFLAVHLVYYACSACREKKLDRARRRVNQEALYQLMLQEEIPQQGKEVVPVKVFVGVPMQIV